MYVTHVKNAVERGGGADGDSQNGRCCRNEYAQYIWKVGPFRAQRKIKCIKKRFFVRGNVLVVFYNIVCITIILLKYTNIYYITLMVATYAARRAI